MLLSSLLLATSAAASALTPRVEATTESSSSSASKTPGQVCTYLTTQLAPGEVFLAGSAEYNNQIKHQIGSAVIPPACVVEPSTPAEVSTLLKTFGKYRTPFAVKNGGHNNNRGFSASSGVQVSMVKFDSIVINNDHTIEVGGGLIWQQVYNHLNGTGLGVCGARVNGPGVSGVTLGGGWCWPVQETGLAIDNLKSAEMVAPNGTVLTTSPTSYPDLFWAIRGGTNKFGIITKFKFRTYAQTNVYGGQYIMGGDGNKTILTMAMDALAKFDATNNDPKASVQLGLFFNPSAVATAIVFTMYNAPGLPPPGTFAAFEAVPHVADTRVPNYPFANFVGDNVVPPSARGSQSGVALRTYSKKFNRAALNAVLDFAETAVAQGKSFAGGGLVFEPYMDVVLSFDKGGAYPHSPTTGAPSMGINFAWTNAADDAYFHSKTLSFTEQVKAVGISTGDSNCEWPLYVNYADYAEPVEHMWQDNLPRLHAIRVRNDPQGVMDLAGGYII